MGAQIILLLSGLFAKELCVDQQLDGVNHDLIW